MQVGFDVAAPARTAGSSLEKISSRHTADNVTCTECGWTGPKLDTQGLSASYCPNCGSMKGIGGDTFPYVKQIVEDAQQATYLDPDLGGVYQPAATLRAEARRAEIIDEQDDSLWSEAYRQHDAKCSYCKGTGCDRCGGFGLVKRDGPGQTSFYSDGSPPKEPVWTSKDRNWFHSPKCACVGCSDKKTVAVRRRVLMPKNAAPQGEGYFVTGPNGGKISGPYATMAEARPHMVQERGATVQYFGPPNDPEWEAYKAQSFPVGLNTVNGSLSSNQKHVVKTDSWPFHGDERMFRPHCENCEWEGHTTPSYATAHREGVQHLTGSRRTAAPTQSTCVNCGKKIDKTESHHGRSGYWSDSEHGGNHCPAAVGAGPHVPAQGEFLGAIDHGGNVPLQHSASDPLLDWEDKAQDAAGENASNDTPKEGSWQERQANVARIRGTRHFAEDDPVVPVADSQQSAAGSPASSESGPCGAQYEADVWVQPQDEDYSILRCTLPPGHAGPHVDEGDEARPDTFSWQAFLHVAAGTSCPTCGNHISDYDMTGCEDVDGQRYCWEHRPADFGQEKGQTCPNCGHNIPEGTVHFKSDRGSCSIVPGGLGGTSRDTLALKTATGDSWSGTHVDSVIPGNGVWVGDVDEYEQYVPEDYCDYCEQNGHTFKQCPKRDTNDLF